MVWEIETKEWEIMMSQKILWSIFGILIGTISLAAGVYGVVRKKQIGSLSNLILSVGQVVLGVFVLIISALYSMGIIGQGR
jgi:hypothetical protein